MPEYFMPVGNTDFKEIRETGLYYIDKTMLIDQLVGRSRAKVTLFTRPRRFGKSLNMSMLQHFFDIREKSEALFEGLQISENKKLCDSWMNKYPTILVSFKDVDGDDYVSASDQLKSIISKLYEQHKYLIGTDNMLEDYEIEKFRALLTANPTDVYLKDSLNFLTKLLYNRYNKTQVILLIDEYDVPMAKGDSKGYYPKIMGIMRTLLSQALKDNPYIKIAVLTGCLRIAEESIFTGLNNPAIKTIVDTDYDECFGFTNEEMDKLLTDTGLIEKQPVFKEWYDGYVFGNREVYCPWDVLNYVDALQKKLNAPPVNYWANTSGNDVIRRFLISEFDVSEEFETLLNGGIIKKQINPNITYGELTKSETNLWSVLYMTGYLTILPGTLPEITADNSDNVTELYELPFTLKIPNKEICILFEQTISDWFKEKVVGEDRTELFNAIWSGDADKLTVEISKFLGDTISYFDYKEDFYHAFLAGLLSGVTGMKVESNRETGLGRADIILKNPRMARVAVFEFKHAKTEKQMISKCDEAVKQVAANEYTFPFREETVYKYGISFFKKKCLVKKA